MLEKDLNNKISVLRSMIGLGEDVEHQFIVPQNSLSNVTQKMGLAERQPTLRDMNTLRDSVPATAKCPHCENMAKNFLYLESLLRSNYNPQKDCHLCYSAIKYLQCVNKSILHVFGHFDSIMEAAQSFAKKPQTRKLIKRKSARLPKSGLKSMTAKGKLANKKSHDITPVVGRQEGGSSISPEVSFQEDDPKPECSTKKVKVAPVLRKKVIKKTTKKSNAKKPNSDNGQNVCTTDVKKRTKTANMVQRALQEKNIKIKRKKGPKPSSLPLE